jgi:hypothetical protein
MKKSPFKMPGTYIGLAIGLVLAYFSFALIFYTAEQGTFASIYLLMPIIILVISIVFGWLINKKIK